MAGRSSSLPKEILDTLVVVVGVTPGIIPAVLMMAMLDRRGGPAPTDVAAAAAPARRVAAVSAILFPSTRNRSLRDKRFEP